MTAPFDGTSPARPRAVDLPDSTFTAPGPAASAALSAPLAATAPLAPTAGPPSPVGVSAAPFAEPVRPGSGFDRAGIGGSGHRPGLFGTGLFGTGVFGTGAPGGDLMPAVEHWLRRPSTSSPSLSPDALTVAYVSDASGVPALWLAPIRPAGHVEAEARMIDTGPAHVHGVSYAPDGRWIALEVAPGGGEYTRVVVVRPDGSGGRMLAGGPMAGPPSSLRGSQAATLGRWTGDGALLGISETRVGPGPMAGDAAVGLVDGYLVSPDSGERTYVATGVALTVCDVSRDGRYALIRRGPRSEREIVLVELGTGVERRLPAAGPDRLGTVGFARFFVDGHTAYLHTDAGRERIALLAVKLPDQGGPEPCGLADTADPTWDDVQVLAARENADLDRFTLVPDGRSVALSWNVDGRSELEILDLETLRRRTLPPLPRDVVTSLLATSDGRWLVMALDGSAAPGQLWTYDLTSGFAGYRRLVAPGEDGPARTGPGPVALASAAPAPAVADSGDAGVARPLSAVADRPVVPDQRPAVRPVLERFRAHDGLELTGWLYRPPATQGPGPLMLHFHGGPESQERPTYNPLFQALVAAGVSVFAPNVRGSAGYGRSFVRGDDGERRFAGIADVASCVEFLTAAGLADPGRIGVMGRSYGGYLTLASLVEYPELFRVGVDVCGIADLETFYRYTEPWIAASAVTKYGDPERDGSLLRTLSPIHRFDRLAAPLLVVHGVNDTNVPLFEAEQTVAAATAVGVPVRFLLFDDEGHEAHGTANRLLFVRTVVSWILDSLLPVEFQHAV